MPRLKLQTKYNNIKRTQFINEKKILISKKYLFARIQKNYFFGSMKISLKIRYYTFKEIRYCIFKEIFIEPKK